MPLNDSLIEALSAELGSLLAARGWRVTAAESCTGGLVAAAITATAGSSSWFDQAFITYSNAAKVDALGVADGVLEAHGAVSEAVACAMADGARARAAADVAVAVTGIAGPGGGTAQKPVGTVCFAWATRNASVVSATRRFDGDRTAIRRASVVAALEGLIARVREGAG